MVNKGILNVIISLISEHYCQYNKKEYTVDDKPIIYIYPTNETRIELELIYEGLLLSSYPEYKEGCNIIVKSDKLNYVEANKKYSFLFWEEEAKNDLKIEEGFIVKGIDTAIFLEQKLSYIGLEVNEYNDFITYWVPRMIKNEYNLIYFAGMEYERNAKLIIKPEPDSILRVFMVYKSIDRPIKIKEQKLKKFMRTGFTVVECGGTKIK